MIDPEALAKVVTTKIKNFAASAGVPSWVYQQKPKNNRPDEPSDDSPAR
jgi:hypothetical protein